MTNGTGGSRKKAMSGRSTRETLDDDGHARRSQASRKKASHVRCSKHEYSPWIRTARQGRRSPETTPSLPRYLGT